MVASGKKRRITGYWRSRHARSLFPMLQQSRTLCTLSGWLYIARKGLQYSRSFWLAMAFARPLFLSVVADVRNTAWSPTGI